MHLTGRVLLCAPIRESVEVRSPFPATDDLRGCGGAIPVRSMLPRRGGSSSCPDEGYVGSAWRLERIVTVARPRMRWSPR